MTDFNEVLKITTTENISELHVEMSSANLIAFNLNYGNINHYHEAITDICHVAPHMMNLDADLQEAYDDAFRTQPKREDQIAVDRFLAKYSGKVDENLAEMFT